MRLLCDENVKGSLYSLLEQEGYEVARVQDALAIGDTDREIIDHCRTEQWILLTNDDDFFAFDTHPGILFLDEQTVPARDVVTAIRRIEGFVDGEELKNQVLHVPDGWV